MNEPRLTAAGRSLGGLVTAVRTLSIVRIPGRGSTSSADALYWFPLVGLLLGSLLCLIAQGLIALPVDIPATGIAVVVLTAGVLLTRGLHLDGLADWADAWWGGYSCTRVLEIMKESHIGTFGVTALILTMLGKWVFYVQLVEAGGCVWIAASFILARTGMVDLAVAQPYARPGDGTAAQLVREAKPRHLLTAVALAAALLLLLPGLSVRDTAVGLLVALPVSRLFGLHCRQRVGGVTGDILGAGNEWIELMTLALGTLLTQGGPTV